MNELDKYQHDAVLAQGNILLIAGAGAGKTYTILKKIEYLIKELDYKEEEILIISFTNKSVLDITKKLNYNIDVLTFHRLAIAILKEYNFTYLLTTDDYLDYVTDEFFKSLSDDTLIKEILKYFKEYSYSKFLNSSKYKYFKYTLVNLIKLIKTCNKNINDIKTIYKLDTFMTKWMLIVYKVYDKELKASGKLDFDDLIIEATNILDKFYKYKYIIVDEFQDTSLIRFNLINKLRIINKAYLFVVGDDYQSIYHFSGCNLDIFLNFQKYIPGSKILKLKYTYRNSQELINIAQNFVIKNNKQLKKDLISHKHNNKPIEYVYYLNPKKAFNKLYKKLKALDDDILVLGRNNIDITKYSSDSSLRFMTVHSAKGLEANYVILINMVDDIMGFPNKLINNILVDKIHPLNEDIPYAEERRLFYVALTRCKEKVYILVPLFHKSEFIKEIKKDC